MFEVFIFLGSKITVDSDCSHEIKRHLLLGKKIMTNLDSVLKSRDITLPTKGRIVKGMDFPVVIYDVRTGQLKRLRAEELMLLVVLEKTLESPLDCKEIQPVNPKGNQPWIFIGRADAEAEASILWPTDTKNRIIGKDPSDGKDWRQEEKGTAEDEMIGWPHWLNGREFEQAPGDGEGQGVLQSMGSQRVRQWLSNRKTTVNIWDTSTNKRFSWTGIKKIERKWKKEITWSDLMLFSVSISGP